MDHQWKPRFENIACDGFAHQPQTDISNFEHVDSC